MQDYLRQLTPRHHQPPVLMGTLGRIRSLNSLSVSDSVLRRVIASLTPDSSHHSARCLFDKYFGVLENCPSIIGDKLRLKASCQGDFRWWLKEKGFPT